MNKKLISILLIITMIFSFSACSKAADSFDKNLNISQASINSAPKAGSETTAVLPAFEDKSLDIPEGQDEITIAAFAADYIDPFLYKYIDGFEKKYNVKVNLDILENSCKTVVSVGDIQYSFTDQNSVEDFYKKLNTKLQDSEGPELIFYGSYSYDYLIKQGAVLNVKDMIPNLGNVYPSLLGTEVYYVPIKIEYQPRALNRLVMDEMKLTEPEFTWKEKDYQGIRKQWLDKYKLYFGTRIYGDITRETINKVTEAAIKSKSISLDNKEFIDFINSARKEVFSGKYEINPNYTYKNFYNLFCDVQSDEFKESILEEISTDFTKHYLNEGSWGNMLKPAISSDVRNAILMPEFADKEVELSSEGFLINRNGKNKELALEFINELLSDKNQMMYYNNIASAYPVNKDIEQAIRDKEADKKYNERLLKLKEYGLNQIKEGKCKLKILHSDKQKKITSMLRDDLVPLIFADKQLTDSELSPELKKLENKYNIWLNE